MPIELSAVAAGAFAAGAISFLSPCVLPLVPGYVSFITGQTVGSETETSLWRPLLLSACFVLGFTDLPHLIADLSKNPLPSGPPDLPARSAKYRFALTEQSVVCRANALARGKI